MALSNGKTFFATIVKKVIKIGIISRIFRGLFEYKNN